ncbi:MAG: hypothetical protein DGJ47_000479 [Rickettsiaceae bacterium]
MKQGIFETIVGMLVLVCAFAFFYYSYNVSGASNSSNTYTLKAEFDNIDGISNGSDVKISGIKVGTIKNVILEKDTYYAVLDLDIDKQVQIPKDSRASVSTHGIIGGRYIRITPGADDSMLQNNDKIIYTQSALNIEDLISKVVHSFTSKK